MSGSSILANGGNLSVCSPSLRYTHALGYEQDSKIQFVVDAVYAFAHAISALQRDVCGGSSGGSGGRNRGRISGACPALLNYDGGDFYTKYLLNVSFIGEFLLKNTRTFRKEEDLLEHCGSNRPFRPQDRR